MLATEDLAAGLGRVITLLGQEASADPLADLGAEIGLANPGADFLLAPVRPDGEAPPGLLSELGTGAPEAGLAIAHPAADARALGAATKTGLQLGITRRDDGLGHETPPSASSPSRGVTACFYFPQLRSRAVGVCNVGIGDKQGRGRRPSGRFCAAASARSFSPLAQRCAALPGCRSLIWRCGESWGGPLGGPRRYCPSEKFGISRVAPKLTTITLA